MAVRMAGLVVEADVAVGVTDAAHGFLRDLAVIDVGLGGDFAGNHDEAGGFRVSAGDAAGRVDGEDRVEDGIGNLVGNLVGMAFADGFGRKRYSAMTAPETKNPGCSGVALRGLEQTNALVHLAGAISFCSLPEDLPLPALQVVLLTRRNDNCSPFRPFGKSAPRPPPHAFRFPPSCYAAAAPAACAGGARRLAGLSGLADLSSAPA